MTDLEPILDEGPDQGPRRRCIQSRRSAPRDRLVRFVLGPSGEILPDIQAILPGRGVWLNAERGAISGAVAKGLFAKVMRHGVRAVPDLPDQVEAMLVRRCLDILGLARRAGQLVAGFDQVADELRAGRAALLVTARDGAADGRRKLGRLAADLPVVRLLDRRELGAAIGRDEVVHLALARGGLATKLSAESRRLAGFRACSDGWEPSLAAEAEEESVRT